MFSCTAKQDRASSTLSLQRFAEHCPWKNLRDRKVSHISPASKHGTDCFFKLCNQEMRCGFPGSPASFNGRSEGQIEKGGPGDFTKIKIHSSTKSSPGDYTWDCRILTSQETTGMGWSKALILQTNTLRPRAVKRFTQCPLNWCLWV